MGFPYEIKSINSKINEQLGNDFKGSEGGFCQVGPQKWVLPAKYKEHAEGYYSMPIMEDDTWIVTYARSGTTLCQELVWLINNNYNYKAASEKSLECRIPFYEFQLLHTDKLNQEMLRFNDNNPKTMEQIQIWNEPGYITGPKMERPRHFKTHLPFSLLPPNLENTCKVVYVARNPKDVAVSYYHLCKFIMLHDFNGRFDKFWEYFEKDLLLWSPYWQHIEEGWQRRNHPNVLFLFYEDLIKDMSKEILKVTNFLNKSITIEQMESLIDHLKIENFKKNVRRHKHIDSVEGFFNLKEQGFIRKGKIGEHEEYDERTLERANRWINWHLSRTSIKFPAGN